jgi:2-oxoglutarate ferredoxin oxidoreductase subunit alpha
MPIVSASTPSDCFGAAYEAARISLQHMTPVILLTDGYIANGAEPWKYPTSADLQEITVNFKKGLAEDEEKFLPYKRDEKLARPWAIPGTPGLEHRVGGLEKQDVTGNVSYDPDNHQHMINVRQAKVDMIANYVPDQTLDSGPSKGKMLVIGWGSTYGSIKSACADLRAEGYEIAHAHLRYIRPFPKNLGEMIKSYDKLLVPEINNGQLVKILRDQYMVDAIPHNKVMGIPITKSELIAKVKTII